MSLAALEAESPGQNSGDAGANSQGQKQKDGGSPGGVLPLAQIKLLKLLQEELNLHTQQLNQVQTVGKPAEELRQQYARLSEEQNRLAELTFQLLRPQRAEGGAMDNAGERKP